MTTATALDSPASWFASQAPRLLAARNRREVAAFRELIASHQQLLARVSSSASASLSMSTSMSMSSSAIHTDAAADASDRYLGAIQRLERELADKTARLAQVAGDQLQLVQESKALLQQRAQWEAQVARLGKQLQEERAIGEEKDRAMAELDAALQLQRDELVRQRQLLASAEAANEQLRRELADKNALLHEWIHNSGDGSKGSRVDGRRSPAVETSEATESLVGCLQLDDALANAAGGSLDGGRLVARAAFAVRAHATEVNSVCFNASGKILFSGSSDGTVRAWDAPFASDFTAPSSTLSALGEYRGVGTAHPLLCVRVSADGALVLGTGCDRKSFIWRVGTGRVSQTLTGHKGKVLAAEFSLVAPTHVLTGSADRSLRLWDVPTGRRLLALSCHSSCNDLAATGEQFASAHQDGVVRFWDARAKSLAYELKGAHEDQVTSVSFAQTGSAFSASPLLLTNSRDHSLRVIDVRTYEVVRELKAPGYRCAFDWSKAALRGDARFAAAGSATGAVLVWDVTSGRLARELRSGGSGGHQGAVACCMWRPDGESLASCDKNGCVVLWE